MKFRLPQHKCGLYLSHNPHKDNYESVKDHLASMEEFYEFYDHEAKQQCIETNELWSLQWYPETPIGFFCIAAPTLQELMAAVAKLDDTVEF